MRKWLLLLAAIGFNVSVAAYGSTLSLTRLDGSAITYLTEVESTFVVEILTPSQNLTAVSPQFTTLKAGDWEAVGIANPRQTPDQWLLFRDTVGFRMDSARMQDGKLQSAVYDSIRVAWTNPYNAKDSVSGSIRIRPAPRQAKIEFTDKYGKQIEGQWPESVFVKVTDQAADPEMKYAVTVIRVPAGNNTGPPDTVVIPLGFSTSGGTTTSTLSSFLSLLFGSTGSSGSGNVISCLTGDLLEAFFEDPADRDTARVRVPYTGADRTAVRAPRIKTPNKGGCRAALKHDGAAYTAYSLQGKRIIWSATAGSSKKILVSSGRKVLIHGQVLVIPGK